MKIGETIRRLRKAKKTTLKGLSEKSGIALATLSRIETNKMVGTVKSHQAIASSLGITLPELYGDIEIEDKAVDFQSQKNRTDTFVHNERASYAMLTNRVLSKKMMPQILGLLKGGVTTPEELPRHTEKFIYILKGECRAHIGSESYTLKKGETLYFDGALRHYFKNIGQGEASALCVVSPPAL